MFRSSLLLRPASLRKFVRPKCFRFIATANSLQEIAERLKATDKASNIHLLYPSFVGALKEKQNNQQSLHNFQEEDVKSMLFKLASSGRPEDLQRIEEVVYDLLPKFQVQPSLGLYNAVTEGLLSKDEVSAVMDWLMKISTLPGNISPTIDSVNHCLKKLTFLSFQSLKQTTFQICRQLGIRPTGDTIRILIQRAWDIYEGEQKIPTASDFRNILRQLETFRVSWDMQTSVLLLQLFTNVGKEHIGRHVQGLYDRSDTGNKPFDPDWLVKLEQMRKMEDVPMSLAFLRSLGQDFPEGQKFRIGQVLLSDTRLVSDLELVDQELGPRWATRRWAHVIRNSIQANEVEEALATYQASRKARVPVDGGLIGPLLRAMSYHTSAGSEDFIDSSLSIYRDLVAEATTGTASSNNPHSTTPDRDIYRCLFRSLSKAENLYKYRSAVDSLLKDMERYDIEVAPGIVEYLICIDMGQASSVEVALKAYRARRDKLQAPGYAMVLQQFARLPFVGMSSSTIREYFGIVKDMQRAGCPITEKVYTILLTQIGFVASEMRRNGTLDEDVHDSLINATRRAHDHLTLDPNLTPSPILFSQLINTYQRLGCFGDAYRVWELMYLTGTYNVQSISNILDACGYAGDLFTAKNVWNRLTKDRYKFDAKHWETYIECLCRCRQLDVATKVLLEDMATTGYDQLNATSILLKFGRKWKVSDIIMDRIKSQNPSLYHRTQTKLKSRS